MEMPKVYCISDLHLEFYTETSQLLNELSFMPDADILILAGDIGYVTDAHRDRYVSLLMHFKSKYKHVIFVAGNHEYYTSKNYDRVTITNELYKIAQETGTIFLEKDTVTIDGIKFYGTTLWTAIDKPATKMMADFDNAFKDQYDYLGEFVDSTRWLNNSLTNELKNPSGCHTQIIITHHLPSALLIHERFKSYNNTGFCSNVLSTLPINNVNYWFCGHTHERMFNKCGNTQLIVNPYGYPNEKMQRYTIVDDKTFTIEPDEKSDKPKDFTGTYYASIPCLENTLEEIQSRIFPEDWLEDPDVSKKPRESDPHISILLGLPEPPSEPFTRVLSNISPIDIEYTSLGVFRNSKVFSDGKVHKWDTLYLKCDTNDSPLLHLHEMFSNEYNIKWHFPQYTPHITVGFLKYGTADKYLSMNVKSKFTAKNLIIKKFRDKLVAPISINFNGSFAASALKSIKNLLSK
jgi:predicted phosphodiesterase